MCRAQAEPKRQVRTQLILLQNQAKRLPSQNPQVSPRDYRVARRDAGTLTASVPAATDAVFHSA